MNDVYTFSSNDENLMRFICKQYYSEKDYQHAERVAQFAMEDHSYWGDNRWRQCFAINLAWAHDLLEDTECPINLFTVDFQKALRFITWNKGETTYDEYLQLLRKGRDIDALGHIAWRVKLLDMKDHLTQTETLTDKLKAKYLSGLRYLL